MGKRRHLARRLALQVLYTNNYLPADPQAIARALAEMREVSSKNWTSLCQELTQRTIERAGELDLAITEALQNWRIERLSLVDHLILRLALCEMRAFPDIPIRVTLNEYIEIAKEFGTEDSSSFVNGILDRLAQDFADKDFQDTSNLTDP